MARGVTFKMRIRVKYEEAKSDNIIWYRWIKRAIDFSAEASNDQEGGRKVSLAICDKQRFYSLNGFTHRPLYCLLAVRFGPGPFGLIVNEKRSISSPNHFK